MQKPKKCIPKKIMPTVLHSIQSSFPMYRINSALSYARPKTRHHPRPPYTTQHTGPTPAHLTADITPPSTLYPRSNYFHIAKQNNLLYQNHGPPNKRPPAPSPASLIISRLCPIPRHSMARIAHPPATQTESPRKCARTAQILFLFFKTFFIPYCFIIMLS